MLFWFGHKNSVINKGPRLKTKQKKLPIQGWTALTATVRVNGWVGSSLGLKYKVNWPNLFLAFLLFFKHINFLYS